MVEQSSIPANAAAAADGQATQALEEPDKQQVQLAAFNEYLHKCRDLFKTDPTMVSQSLVAFIFTHIYLI